MQKALYQRLQVGGPDRHGFGGPVGADSFVCAVELAEWTVLLGLGSPSLGSPAPGMLFGVVDQREL